MPQQGGSAPIKTKKKGRQPAHMNKGFAFRHNPKSKKTDKILASVNQHCCRRCHEKIEWRKAYRKYKPRTQLGSCNLCKQKRVKAAYHTICTKCTTSDKAWRFCREAKVKTMGGNVSDITEAKEGEDEEEEEELNEEEGEIENKKLAATLLAMASKPALRVCAVCVKEKSMRDADGGDADVSEIIARMGPMSLRESRGLERQLLRQQQEESDELPSDDKEEDEEEDAGEGDDNEEQDGEQVADEGEQPAEGDDDDNSNEPLEEEEDYREEQDPFLQAVGGADKLLTGAAYQEMILAKTGEKATDA